MPKRDLETFLLMSRNRPDHNNDFAHDEVADATASTPVAVETAAEATRNETAAEIVGEEEIRGP